MAAEGVFTELYREKYARMAAENHATAKADLEDIRLDSFKIGEGGSVGGPGTDPDTPDPTRTDIVAQTEGPGVPSDLGDRYFEKALTNAQISHVQKVLTVVCEITAGEANWSPEGHFYEIGIFDKDGDMIVYATFDEEIKTSDKSLRHEITITY